MKLSELIIKLQELEKEHPDAEVLVEATSYSDVHSEIGSANSVRFEDNGTVWISSDKEK